MKISCQTAFGWSCKIPLYVVTFYPQLQWLYQKRQVSRSELLRVKKCKPSLINHMQPRNYNSSNRWKPTKVSTHCLLRGKTQKMDTSLKKKWAHTFYFAYKHTNVVITHLISKWLPDMPGFFFKKKASCMQRSKIQSTLLAIWNLFTTSLKKHVERVMLCHYQNYILEQILLSS